MVKFGWHTTIECGVGDPGQEVYYFLGIPLWQRRIDLNCRGFDPQVSLFGEW